MDHFFNYFGGEDPFLNDYDEFENEIDVHLLVIEGLIEKIEEFLNIKVPEKIKKEKTLESNGSVTFKEENLQPEIEELKLIYLNYEDSKYGLRPLHLATIKKNLSMVKYLVEKKCDITLQDSYGATACKKKKIIFFKAKRS
jgi:ankyrin repeat protein